MEFSTSCFFSAFETLKKKEKKNMKIHKSSLVSIFSVIQQSHPVCNTIMLFGVIICLFSVILLGVDGRFVEPDTYPKVQLFFCHYAKKEYNLLNEKKKEKTRKKVNQQP